MTPIVPNDARIIMLGREPFLILNFSGLLASIMYDITIATRFLKNAFWNTGISPARLMNKAMQAKENDDKRRYTIPLLRGDNLSKNLTVTACFSLLNFQKIL
jgi:hypothetical protein